MCGCPCMAWVLWQQWVLRCGQGRTLTAADHWQLWWCCWMVLQMMAVVLARRR
jgi:hypothetical protein